MNFIQNICGISKNFFSLLYESFFEAYILWEALEQVRDAKSILIASKALDKEKKLLAAYAA